MRYFDQQVQPYFWPRTATLDWCEENYVQCKYIAEFWNSLTNILFLALALLGAWQVWKQRQATAFLWAYVSFGVVGFGSFLFHATLSYEMQLLDELPMIYTVAILTYCIIQVDKTSKHSRPWLKKLLLLDVLAISLIYLAYPNPLFHQIAYGTHYAIIAYFFHRHYNRLSPSPPKQRLHWLIAASWMWNILGFAFWNLDNWACDWLRHGRSQLGPNLAWLLQFHGWWHVFAALGSYTYIMANQYLQLIMEGRDSEFELTWKFFILPRLSLINDLKAD